MDAVSTSLEPVVDEQPKKQKEACVQCRAAKVKCRALSEQSLPNDICQRCTRIKQECTYHTQKRGRKAGSGAKRPKIVAQDMDAEMASVSASPSSTSQVQLQADYSLPRGIPRPLSFETPTIQRPTSAGYSDRSSSYSGSSLQYDTSLAGHPGLSGPSSQNYVQSYPSPFASASLRPPLPSSHDGGGGGGGGQTSLGTNQSPNPAVSMPPPAYPASQQHHLPTFTQPSSRLSPTFLPQPHSSGVAQSPSASTQGGRGQSFAGSDGDRAMHFPSPRAHPDHNFRPPALPSPWQTTQNPNGTTGSPYGHGHQLSFARGAELPPPPVDHPSVASSGSFHSRSSQRSTQSSATRSHSQALSLKGLLNDSVETEMTVSGSAPSQASETHYESHVHDYSTLAPPDLGQGKALSLADVLDRQRDDSAGSGVPAVEPAPPEPPKVAEAWIDPVSSGILQPAEAVSLFESFHQRLNVFVDLLDPALHTPTYVREQSTILFTAILTVAAKVQQPAAYPALLALSTSFLARAFVEGVCNIGLIQALSLLAFWKETKDNGAWRRVGYAIRLAYELDLHLGPKRPLPDGELAARQQLDRERTWLQLSCFDATLMLQQGRPRMIQISEHPDTDNWVLDHPEYKCTSDPMLASSLALLRVTEFCQNVGRLQEPSVKFAMMAHVRESFHRWQRDWTLGEPKCELHPSIEVMVRFYDRLITFELDVVQLSLVSADIPDLASHPTSADGAFADHSPPTQEALLAFSQCITSALSVLRYLSSDLQSFLIYSQDTITFGTASAGLWLAKNVTRMPRLAGEAVLTALRQATFTCRAVAKDPHDASAYQARFFQSLLQTSTTSASPTRRQSPRAAFSRFQQLPSSEANAASSPFNSAVSRTFPYNPALGPQAAGVEDGGVDLTALDLQLSEMNHVGGFSIGDMSAQPEVFEDLFKDGFSQWLPSGHGFGDPMIAQNFASAVNEGMWPNGHGSGNG